MTICLQVSRRHFPHICDLILVFGNEPGPSNGRRVAVQYRRNNPTVEEAKPGVVFGTWCKCCHRLVTVPITTELEPIRIGAATPKAGEVRIERLLNAQMGLRWQHCGLPKAECHETVMRSAGHDWRQQIEEHIASVRRARTNAPRPNPMSPTFRHTHRFAPGGGLEPPTSGSKGRRSAD